MSSVTMARAASLWPASVIRSASVWPDLSSASVRVSETVSTAMPTGMKSLSAPAMSVLLTPLLRVAATNQPGVRGQWRWPLGGRCGIGKMPKQVAPEPDMRAKAAPSACERSEGLADDGRKRERRREKIVAGRCASQSRSARAVNVVGSGGRGALRFDASAENTRGVSTATPGLTSTRSRTGKSAHRLELLADAARDERCWPPGTSARRRRAPARGRPGRRSSMAMSASFASARSVAAASLDPPPTPGDDRDVLFERDGDRAALPTQSGRRRRRARGARDCRRRTGTWPANGPVTAKLSASTGRWTETLSPKAVNTDRLSMR